ncbi:hydroxymethylglutaryl-CoA lyase [Halobacteriovorax marinus]|uniref:Hydroxymethylglutaryl-CoA lyase n=1 Tax=Halobacteriovorax marinus TaxID=97084 RepID=A0A1Y5F9M3_9BACT|nr:hydroxymethylglutaryl-CoA lyase [Halobacteriovorax marinus]
MFKNLPKDVRIIEVGPRDGLQNEKVVLSTEDKVQFIDKLVVAGLKSIEVTSFVRADKIPQMSDAKELFATISKKEYFNDIHAPCLVPNLKGMQIAIEQGVKEVAIFTATSDTFNKKNINATLAESLKRFEPVVALANKHNMKIRGYVSTVFGCPYEGETSVDALLSTIATLKDFGCYEVSLGDTIGVGNPLQTKNILERVFKTFSAKDIALHFHDTRGMALANILAALELGALNFDASAAGLGGCPYAKGATGNVATEDVVHMFESMGINTGVDMKKLAASSQFILNKLNKETPSKYLKAFLSTGI